MGDRELSPVDFADLAKNVSFYSTSTSDKHRTGGGEGGGQPGDDPPSSCGGLMDGSSKQLLFTAGSNNDRLVDDLQVKPVGGVSPTADGGVNGKELQNGGGLSKESSAYVDSVITSLSQLGLQGGVQGSSGTPWEDHGLSPAVCQMLAAQQSSLSNAAFQQQQRRAITGQGFPHHQHQRAIAQLQQQQQGNLFMNNLQAYQTWGNGGNPSGTPPQPIQGGGSAWSRQGSGFNTPWGPHQQQRRPLPVRAGGQQMMSSAGTMSDPALMISATKYRQNSPFPRNVQQLVSGGKSDLRGTEDGRDCRNVLGLTSVSMDCFANHNKLSILQNYIYSFVQW